MTHIHRQLENFVKKNLVCGYFKSLSVKIRHYIASRHTCRLFQQNEQSLLRFQLKLVELIINPSRRDF